jgi:hypothetical protein
MFRNLPPYEPPVRELTGLASLDEGLKRRYFEDLAAKMAEPISKATDPQLDGTIPAGYTYLGQFITHDLTFDPATSLQRRNDPNMLRNFRTPCFDLDSLYGRGPQDSPYMYDVRQNDKFIFGRGENRQEQDLPRNYQGVAMIGDPRNDENIMISQLHVAFLRFHNSVVYLLESTSDLKGDDLFREAQRIVQWHYQWIVVNDYLRRYVVADPGYVDQLMEKAARRPFSGFVAYYWKEAPFLPIEFSAAAFRFGHSMIRSSYDINYLHENIPFMSIPGPWGNDPQQQLIGFRKLPAGFTVQWDRFFRFAGSPEPQPSRQIDTLLAAALSNLPGQLAPYQTSLAFLDLARGWKLRLPSGQSAARAIGIPESDVLDGHDGHDDPLWYYILREAKEAQDGFRLGPLGSTLVAEVFIGLLAGDPQSYINVERNWRPSLPSAHPGDFTMSDLLTFADAPITQRDVELVIGDVHTDSPLTASKTRWPA